MVIIMYITTHTRNLPDTGAEQEETRGQVVNFFLAEKRGNCWVIVFDLLFYFSIGSEKTKFKAFYVFEKIWLLNVCKPEK